MTREDFRMIFETYAPEFWVNDEDVVDAEYATANIARFTDLDVYESGADDEEEHENYVRIAYDFLPADDDSGLVPVNRNHKYSNKWKDDEKITDTDYLIARVKKLYASYNKQVKQLHLDEDVHEDVPENETGPTTANGVPVLSW